MHNRLSIIFKTMNKLTTLIITRAGAIQVILAFALMVIFQCRQNDGASKSAGKTIPSNLADSSFMYTTPLSEETKSALQKLAEPTMVEGNIGEQMTTFIKNGIYDYGEQFKFIDLRWEGRSAKLKEKSRLEIDDLGRIMLLFPKLRIKMESYLDNNGNQKQDEKITQARVEYIKSQLVSVGVQPERIEVRGFGSKYPVGDNKTYEGRQINDRIEVTILQLF
ncbi:MAG: OmpA family protein [Saprospiraceae bacterium]|nr:OmpA family protein [Candidatus Vicinibacter affinis]MBK6573037.1 OmpA family protein [Candidatus Vicinibacter affinis]MBK6822501.1 OmpA family protein [Candidatus Vicinibacter affinis]MBK8640872.1 OmpA family protein [Candidatus Vicinibacter affinis]HQX42929.1 OmpA family protein [Saprospiraceae bacterium]